MEKEVYADRVLDDFLPKYQLEVVSSCVRARTNALSRPLDVKNISFQTSWTRARPLDLRFGALGTVSVTCNSCPSPYAFTSYVGAFVGFSSSTCEFMILVRGVRVLKLTEPPLEGGWEDAGFTVNVAPAEDPS